MGVFFSHSSADKHLLTELVAGLKAKEIPVWLDDWSLAPGDSLARKIGEGIAACTHFLVALSPRSIRSNWVRHELDAALLREIEEGTRIAIAVLIGRIGEADIPRALRGRLWVDLRRRGTKRYAQEFQRLVAVLKSASHPTIDLGESDVSVDFQRLLDLYVVELARKYPRGQYSCRFREDPIREGPNPGSKDGCWHEEDQFCSNLHDAHTWEVDVVPRDSRMVHLTLKKSLIYLFLEFTGITYDSPNDPSWYSITVDPAKSLSVDGEQVPLSGGQVSVHIHDELGSFLERQGIKRRGWPW